MSKGIIRDENGLTPNQVFCKGECGKVLRKRLKYGYCRECGIRDGIWTYILTNKCPVRIRGVDYDSIESAAKALNVNPHTIRRALDRGTVDNVGLKMHDYGKKPKIPKKAFPFMGKVYESVLACSKATGIPYVKLTQMNYRRKKFDREPTPELLMKLMMEGEHNLREGIKQTAYTHLRPEYKRARKSKRPMIKLPDYDSCFDSEGRHMSELDNRPSMTAGKLRHK